MKTTRKMIAALLVLCLALGLAALIPLTGCERALPSGNPADPSDDDPSGQPKEFVYKGKNVMDNLGPETGTIKFQAGGGGA